VEVKAGRNGNTWVFATADGTRYGTTDAGLGALAKQLSGKRARVVFTETTRGRQIDDITELAPARSAGRVDGFEPVGDDDIPF
jgi:hypothetical protein